MAPTFFASPDPADAVSEERVLGGPDPEGTPVSQPTIHRGARRI